jgi:hypothetical protein
MYLIKPYTTGQLQTSPDFWQSIRNYTILHIIHKESQHFLSHPHCLSTDGLSSYFAAEESSFLRCWLKRMLTALLHY